MIKGRGWHSLGRPRLASHREARVRASGSARAEASSSLTVSADGSWVFTYRLAFAPSWDLGSQLRPLCVGWDSFPHLNVLMVLSGFHKV